MPVALPIAADLPISLEGLLREVERLGYNFQQNLPKLIADPVLALSGQFTPYPSVALNIQNLPCTLNAVFISHYIHRSTLPNLYPPPGLTLANMVSFMARIGCRDFPIYMAIMPPVPNPPNNAPGPRPTLTLVSGIRRADGLAMLYTPQLHVPVPPGQPPPPAIDPHFSIIINRWTASRDLHRYVYFGDVFMGVNFYWHAQRPSPEYTMMARIGRACMCQRRCKHEPPEVQGMPAFSFKPFPFNGDLWIAEIEDILNPRYTHGLNGKLCYTSPHGHLLSDGPAFDYSTRVDVKEMDSLSLTTPDFRIEMYKLPRIDITRVLAGGMTAFGVAKIFSSYLLFPTLRQLRGMDLLPSPIRALPWFHPARLFMSLKLRILSVTHELAMDLNPADPGWVKPTLEAPYHLINSMTPATAFLAVGSIAAVLMWAGFDKWARLRTRTFSELPFARGAIPKTMRLSQTEVGQKLMATVALHKNWTERDLYALVRRLGSEMRYRHGMEPTEVDEWVRRNITVEGSAPIPAIPVGCCATCLRKRRLRHLICHECKIMLKVPLCWSPVTPYLILHVGMRPLHTIPPIFPAKDYDKEWRDYTKVVRFGRHTYETFLGMVGDLLKLLPPEPTTRGQLCGPMFMGQQPKCFERGDYMAAMAAGARLLIMPPKHYATPHGPYPFLTEFRSLIPVARSLFPDLFVPLIPWTQQQVLDHQRQLVKRRLLERSYQEIDEGLTPPVEDMLRVKPFVKSEKHFADSYDHYTLVNKTKQVPRCINPVHPHVNAYCAPYTLPTSKLLNQVCNCGEHIFYASGATPEEINVFLNNACSVNQYIIEDDVSMADGSHSKGSFEFQQAFLMANWLLPSLVQEIIEGMRHGRLATGRFSAFVSWVNLSGVPLTSWSNTITFIFVRLVALGYAYEFLELEDPFSAVTQLRQLIRAIYMAVAGDDGKTFLPPMFRGVRSGTAKFIQRYSFAWAYYGFSVEAEKIRWFTPANWRLSTFLAMRPYWSGQRYEYGVEIARRMRSMFWQIDNNMHPVSWARGVAESLLKCSRHVPVVREICDWYLARTKGATNSDVSFTNPYSTFYGYSIEGDMTERTMQEFLQDYQITLDQYSDFRRLLHDTHDVLVNIHHVVLEKVFALE